MKAKPETKEKLFNNPVAQVFSYTNRYITGGYIITYILFLFWLHLKLNPETPMLFSLGLFIGGVLLWTLFEYLIHRYLFHLKGDSTFIKKFTYLMHGVHHKQPRVENWVFMPPLPGTFYVVVFFGLFGLLLNSFAPVFLSGFLLGYLIYAIIHFYIHLKKPIKRFSFFWRHHSLHHYKYPSKAFGVSSPLWDIVFHTMPPSKSESASNLKS